jgi:hypothetical protein
VTRITPARKIAARLEAQVLGRTVKSRDGREPMRFAKALGIILLGAIVATVVANIDDVRRYIRISTM